MIYQNQNPGSSISRNPNTPKGMQHPFVTIALSLMIIKVQKNVSPLGDSLCGRGVVGRRSLQKQKNKNKIIVNFCSLTPNSLPFHVLYQFLFIPSGHLSSLIFIYFLKAFYLCHIRPLLLSLLWSPNTYLSPKNEHDTQPVSMIFSLEPSTVLSTPLPPCLSIASQSQTNPTVCLLVPSARQLNSSEKTNSTLFLRNALQIQVFTVSICPSNVPGNPFFFSSFIPSVTPSVPLPSLSPLLSQLVALS